MTEIDAVHQLLIACAIAPIGVDVPAQAWMRALESRERLLHAACEHQLRPQLAARFARRPPEAGAVPWEELDAAAGAYRGHGVLMAAEMVRVLETLRKDGVRAVPFKGPAAAALQGEGPQMREMCDLDVLIDKADIGRATDALLPLGYVPKLPAHVLASRWLASVTNELGLTALGNATFVELHWRFAPPWFPVAVDANEVLGGAVERDLFGARILWPRQEELLLLHVTDGIKSGGSIRWVGDLASIIRAGDLDWARLCGIAGRNGGLDSVRIALALLDDLSQGLAGAWQDAGFAVRLPPGAMPLVREGRKQERLRVSVRDIRRRLAGDARMRGGIAHFRWALRMSDRPRVTAAHIGRHLLGPSISDLATMPLRGCSDIRLRIRAMRRRLGVA